MPSNQIPDKHFPGNACDFDISHNSMQIFSRRGNLTIIRGMARPQPVPLRLEQYGQRPADLRLQVGALRLVRRLLRLVGAGVFYRVTELLRHGVRLRARAAGIRKHVHG